MLRVLVVAYLKKRRTI